MEELIGFSYDTYSQLDEIVRTYGSPCDEGDSSENATLPSSILQIAPFLFLDFPEDSQDQNEVTDAHSQQGEEEVVEEDSNRHEPSDEPEPQESNKKQSVSNTPNSSETHEQVKRHDSKGAIKQFIKQQQQPSFEQYFRQRKQFQERRKQSGVNKQEQQIAQEQQCLEELSFMAQRLKSSTAAISTVIQNDKTVFFRTLFPSFSSQAPSPALIIVF